MGALRLLIFQHARLTEAGPTASFCWTGCLTHGPNVSRFLLNRPMPPDIQPVCMCLVCCKKLAGLSTYLPSTPHTFTGIENYCSCCMMGIVVCSGKRRRDITICLIPPLFNYDVNAILEFGFIVNTAIITQYMYSLKLYLPFKTQ